MENTTDLLQQHTSSSSFIKPLPCGGPKSPVVAHSELFYNRHQSAASESSSSKNKQSTRVNAQDDVVPPITLDPPPQGKRHGASGASKRPDCSRRDEESARSKNEKIEKNLATILRTSGPAPTRTTSARLPMRNDVLGQVQRTAWARHTTKWIFIIFSNGYNYDIIYKVLCGKNKVMKIINK